MGSDPMVFYSCAVLASMMFALEAYLLMPTTFIAFLMGRWMTKKDPLFFTIFLRYLDEKHAFSSLPRPEDWSRRPAGWGRGLPW